MTKCRICKLDRSLDEFPDWQLKNYRNPACKDCLSKRGSKRCLNCKIIVIKHYSNGTMKCNCCGESRVEFLSTDHIDGLKKNEIRISGRAFYVRLIHEHFPPGYQILCFNCNLSKGFFGYCPHEKERMKEEIPLTKEPPPSGPITM